MSTVYNILMILFSLSSKLYALFDKKVKDRNRELHQQYNRKAQKNGVLIHVASLGEYEMALPLIQWILENRTEHIHISFFSPSGFNHAQIVHSRISKWYLPYDTRSSIKRFFDHLNPSKILLIKNEWWWNLIYSAFSNKIPIYSVSSSPREEEYFNRICNNFFKKRFEMFSRIFVTNKSAQNLLLRNFNVASDVISDTKKQRARSLASSNKNKYSTHYPTFVYGSIWPSDLEIINASIKNVPDARHLIYPHDLSQQNIEKLSKVLNARILYKVPDTEGRFIIATMGELKYSYKMAIAAYIGGAFGSGLHNILEASAYGIPVFFGPKFQKNMEAKELLDLNVAHTISKAREIPKLHKLLFKDSYQSETKASLINYFAASSGSTDFICSRIFN